MHFPLFHAQKVTILLLHCHIQDLLNGKPVIYIKLLQ